MSNSVFERYERKYLLDAAQYKALLVRLQLFMEFDAYGKHTISNVYYDTEDNRLIRASLDKPDYKEKLRLRAYGEVNRDARVYLELKKKCDNIVYKRRAAMTLSEAKSFLEGTRSADSQILREIDYFMKFYAPEPRLYLAYERIALYGRENAALRVTFDTNIRWRRERLDLTQGSRGELLTDRILMEIKIPGAMPVWMAETLCAVGARPGSFSKYGYCYANNREAFEDAKGGLLCA